MIIIQLLLSVFPVPPSLQISIFRIFASTPRLHSFNMKWLLALVPFVAGLPSLPTQEIADAPPAGSVSYINAHYEESD